MTCRLTPLCQTLYICLEASCHELEKLNIFTERDLSFMLSRDAFFIRNLSTLKDEKSSLFLPYLHSHLWVHECIDIWTISIMYEPLELIQICYFNKYFPTNYHESHNICSMKKVVSIINTTSSHALAAGGGESKTCICNVVENKSHLTTATSHNARQQMPCPTFQICRIVVHLA